MGRETAFMKKLAPHRQAEIMKAMFTHRVPIRQVEETLTKTGKQKKNPTYSWRVDGCDIKLNDKGIDSMEDKGFIEPAGGASFKLTENGAALAEMMCGQKTFDFRQNSFRDVKSYEAV
jgi:hypothetical protein